MRKVPFEDDYPEVPYYDWDRQFVRVLDYKPCRNCGTPTEWIDTSWPVDYFICSYKCHVEDEDLLDKKLRGLYVKED